MSGPPEDRDPRRIDPDRLADLVRAAQRGDMLAVDELLTAITPYVRALCGPIALDLGPDAVQETLIAVFGHLRRLRDPRALFGWVRVIAVREAVKVARSRPVAAELPELPAPGDVELAVDVADVLRRLSPQHRAILVLRDLEGLDEQHAARLLEVPVGTVKSRLARARASFRREWRA
ncbi:RNA polymerase sigma factor (sigma-70 family) [Nocardia sp. GAS34]|uniref:RNA polymerase sigma factor n=1 Tax=unclassified Nocardia TaxID=2637762 RepID=UPI003D1E6874